MINSEFFPIISGVLAGCLLGLIRPRIRLWIGVPMAIALGVLATVVSGEFQLSWGFLLIDIPFVATSAALGLLLARRVRSKAEIGFNK